jgi:hypothetical protein
LDFGFWIESHNPKSDWINPKSKTCTVGDSLPSGDSIQNPKSDRVNPKSKIVNPKSE